MLSRASLAQLVRLLVVELTHSNSNPRFDMSVIFMANYSFKIKPTQYFGDAHGGRVCVPMFIRISANKCMSIYVCTVFLKKSNNVKIHLFQCCMIEETLHDS
jgi:hypothetical protein